MTLASLDRAAAALHDADLHARRGQVRNLIGLVVEATGLQAQVGELCHITTGRARHGREPIPAEVVGFRDGATLLMPLGPLEGIGPGSTVTATGTELRVDVGDGLLGRVVDGLGRPIDGGPPIEEATPRSTDADPPDPLTRPRITERITLGVRALDALVPCGRGQRLGIFAGSGVGKSSLLGMIARSTSAQVNVICLVGERGREVREFLERDLGDAIEHSVVVVATSDQPALVRLKAAFTATAVAEHFRDAGRDVMLMMDSVTRFAMAQREVGLAVGEPPATRGYTPSVFAMLPKLLERSGTSPNGSITALYTVLVDGGDMDEPVADAVRGILDGHVVLTRELAHKAHYPAIDVLQSVSRLTSEIMPPDMQRAAQVVRELMSAYREKEDLIAIGAYQRGTDPLTDRAIESREAIELFLKQGPDEGTAAEDSDRLLRMLAGEPQPAQDAEAEAREDTGPTAGAAGPATATPDPDPSAVAPALDGDSPVRQSALPPLGLALPS
jgi:flagellum-specific ATP synthase